MHGDTRELRTALEKWARDVEPRLLDGADAARLVRHVARMESICASVKARLARRVEETNVWQRGGHKTAAHFLASTTGTSIHQAVTTLRTAECLEALPATAEAFSSGRVSQAQANEITAAAIEAPEAEGELLRTADERNHARLRDTCRRVKASATDELERHRRAHAARALRSWTDAGGAWHLHANGTPTDGARIMAKLNAETETVFREARRAGVRESTEAYRFDALVRLAEHAGDGVRARPHFFVNVDAQVLTSGNVGPGERCEIKGVGPVPVATARSLLGDALLTILVKHGVDVTTVAHDGTKAMPASVRRAVLARDPECVVDVCSAPTTEVHHLRYRADGGEHSTKNCVGTCGWCHDLVHYHGYEVIPNGDGTYRLRAPPDRQRD